MFPLAAKFDIEPYDVVRSSVALLKTVFVLIFSKLLQSVLCSFVPFVFYHVFYCSCCICAY